MTTSGLPRSVAAPRAEAAEAAARVTRAEAEAMLRAVLALFDKWQLSRHDRLVLLGAPSERTFQRWSSGQVGPLPNDTVHRLGDLLGIHKALRYMMTDLDAVYGWVRRPNAAFGGRAAVEVMLQGAPADLHRVRAYLDAERGGW